MAWLHFHIIKHLSENGTFASQNCTRKLPNGNHCIFHFQYGHLRESGMRWSQSPNFHMYLVDLNRM